MVTSPLWFVPWHWRWECRSEGRHGITLALHLDGFRSPKRMDNRLFSPECTHIHASFGIIPCMYDKKTVQNSTFSVDGCKSCKPKNQACRPTPPHLQLRSCSPHFVHTTHLYTCLRHFRRILKYKHYAIGATLSSHSSLLLLHHRLHPLVCITKENGGDPLRRGCLRERSRCGRSCRGRGPSEGCRSARGECRRRRRWRRCRRKHRRRRQWGPCSFWLGILRFGGLVPWVSFSLLTC